MLSYLCDYCRQPIIEVVYTLSAESTRTGNALNTTVHLHWHCVPKYGRNDA